MVEWNPRANELFVHALQLSDPAARAEYLAREWGVDDRVRAEVDALLRAHARAGDFLDPPADADRTGAYPARPADLVGRIIADRYKLLQLVGEGGMGAVYMADQLEPIKRRVAVKLIRAERGNSKTILSRFEAERQAIALMDHPNIAKLLDAGSTEADEPYFVMELVKGTPLTQYCDEHRLSVGDRLGLFMQICSAVQHAHQKGIIHRDLKPTNILVESHDDKPVPKVIDFGLAKATSGMQLTEHTLFTALGTVAGTPLYMAPEQARFNAIDVDTRADVYALGVILYELLTGTTPIERGHLKAAAFDEMLRLVREQEPPTPSKRLSSSDSKPSVAANRQTEPVKLGRFVKGELDWIVMKALAKERDRRYDTATGFARDVERFLNHEPVVAGPPSARYKVRKFVQRNRGQVIAGGLVLLALVAGIAGTTASLIRAEQQRHLAEARQEEAEGERAKAAAAAAAEIEHRQKAEQAEAETLADFRASTDDAIEQLIGSKRELGRQETTYLENTLKRWQAFAGRQKDDERGRVIRAEGYFRVAVLWQRLGRPEEARAEYTAALALREKLVEQFPTTPAYRQDLARTHNNLGVVLKDLGRPDDALGEHRAARDIRQPLMDQFPSRPELRNELASTHNNLGNLLADLGKPEEARVEFQAARGLRAELVGRLPAVPAYQKGLADIHNNLGTVLAGLGEREAARTEYGAARDLRRKLADRSPSAAEYRHDLAATHGNMGSLLADLGKPEEARAEFQAARDLETELVGQFPAVPAYQVGLASTHGRLGALLADLGKREEARAEFRAACALRKALADKFPANPRYQIDLGGSYGNYARLIRDDGNPAESLEWFDLAIQILQAVHTKEPRYALARKFLRDTHWDRAAAYDRIQKPAEAVKDWDRAIALSPPAERPGLRANRATSQIQAGMVAAAVAEVAELTAPSANPAGSLPWDAGQWYDFACVYAVASGKVTEKKQEYADRAMELLQKAVQAGHTNAAHMAKDTDLDPLRGRDDFKKLIASLPKPNASADGPPVEPGTPPRPRTP